MDYSLKSLRDAFEDAEYKLSRRGYDLYAILLATSLDQDFVLEYLSFFHELDSLTGDKVLVIGPHLGPLGQDHNHDDAPRLLSSQLHGVRQIVGRTSPDAMLSGVGSTVAVEQFLAFMQEQTRESYAIARYLGAPLSSMPLIVFFDNLDTPQHRVEWALQGKRGEDVVRELRHLLKAVSDECGWDLLPRERQLQERATTFNQTYYSPRDVPFELRAEWEAWRNSEGHVAQISQITAYYRNIVELRNAYDHARTDHDLRIPLDNVGDTLAKLEDGFVAGDSFAHLAGHYRRWKSRMPAEYKQALARITSPVRACEYVQSGKLTLTPGQASSEEARIREDARQLKLAYETKRSQLTSESAVALEQVQADIARRRPAPLQVVQHRLGVKASLIHTPLDTNLKTIIRTRPRKVPTVFVSYSHDAPQHAARVLEVAQRLRADGADCWIDQFEQGPSEGFPRWMMQQIKQADFVLLVCTETYCRRFDGLEERGRGLGANFEGYLILQELHDAGMANRKFIPILLPPSARKHIPTALRGTESFELPAAYDRLLNRIFGIPATEPHPLGCSIERSWSF